MRAFLLPLAVLLDFFWGDPDWITHPVVRMGQLISLLERRLRPWCERGGERKKGRELLAGGVLVGIVCWVSFFLPALLLGLLERCHPAVSFCLSLFLAFYLLAARTLEKEARGVYLALGESLSAGRERVSRIVGRDTKNLTREGVIKATVETVAENTTDGVIAPLFYLALGGVPLMCLYKAINTMDSMLGYRNERYLYFGRVAARLDDVANFLPSRLAAVLMLMATPLAGLSFWGALRSFGKYRYAHKSPNSAQTESVMAGALGVELAGDAFYFGRLVKKPTIGEELRPIREEDILLANRLLFITQALAVLCWILVCSLIRMGG